MRISARTRVFALLGDPVSHSLSPRIQNAAFQAAGIDAVYIALQVTASDLTAQMTTLVRRGGGNVTVPFKEVAAAAAGRREPRVELLGSANVFGGDDGDLQLGNTDVDGIVAALDQLEAPADAWCVVGTGGSARAAVGAAAERGARIAVRSRDPARAVAFGAWAASIGVAAAEPAECSVVINATPLGLSAGDASPINIASLSPNTMVLDLVYRADETTALVRACSAIGLRAADGREVLLAQGAASWRIWFPGVTPPVEVMRAALDGRLV